MKWPKKHTKDQIINAAINLAVKKEFYKFDSVENIEAKLANVDSKDQAHISEMVKEVVKDLTEQELLKVNSNSTVSLTTDGISYVLSALPKAYF